MKPFYEQSGITIYHGDCAKVMGDLWSGFRTGAASFDLLLSDPPYGIGEARGKNATRGKTTHISGRKALAESTDWGVSDWDDKPAHSEIAQARGLCKWQIIFGGNYYDLPPSSCWLVWDKENGETDFADCELAWTNLKKAVRKLTYRWNGMLQQPGRPKEIRQHPTQKPEAVMVWALTQAPQDIKTVFDPFMGSGTSLVAAKRLGKRGVGIEREEKYCEIAANRLRQDALPLEVA